jgi:CspA family cold shock protein
VATKGTVREWNALEALGVIDSKATPGGCWVHFSAVRVPGIELHVGEEVLFDYEQADQDSYSYRATRVMVEGEEPVEPTIIRAEQADAVLSATVTISCPECDTAVVADLAPDGTVTCTTCGWSMTLSG